MSFEKTESLPLTIPTLTETVAQRLVQQVLAAAWVGRIPTSTYRLQFNQDLTFDDARQWLDYWHRLGVGDLYGSPTFAATSPHGYDITAHDHWNPALGGDEAFAALLDDIEVHGMGYVADIVPNHMGVTSNANRWWNEVLENGEASPYSRHFDIDWHPLRVGMDGQVLLPILGDSYGTVLERGDLSLVEESGAFFLNTPARRLPLDPCSYVDILRALRETMISGQAIPALSNGGYRDTLSSSLIELDSILTALGYLPDRRDFTVDAIIERQREKEVIKQRVARWLDETEGAREALQVTLATFNGTPGDPVSFNALEAILAQQAYRLAYWRVAAEEINYRRFFDINDLAAIRVEEPAVFDEMHGLLLRTVAQGKITGVRIDHPDGLWNPAAYFSDLQRSAVLTAAYAQWDGDLSDAERVMLERAVDETLAAPDRNHPLYVVAEKIVEPKEQLPTDWAVAGTTGYDFMNEVGGLWVQSANEKTFTRFYEQFIQDKPRWDAMVTEAKAQILDHHLASELNVLADALLRLSDRDRHTRDYTFGTLHTALKELIVALPVYRSYLTPFRGEKDEGRGARSEGMYSRAESGEWRVESTATTTETHPLTSSKEGEYGKLPLSTMERGLGGEVSGHDREVWQSALKTVQRRYPDWDPGLFAFLQSLFGGEDEHLPLEERRLRRDFVMRVQQITGPTMAKGVEDTSYYRYVRFAMLNEVGGDPHRFGVTPAAFHRANTNRAKRWAHTMLGTSTHDTKRSEDVRARLAVLSEMPVLWEKAVRRWHRRLLSKKTKVEGERAPDRIDEYLFYQTLVGIYPLDDHQGEENRRTFAQRLVEYMLKAAKESKRHTSWLQANEAYENALSSFVRGALADKEFLDLFLPLQRTVAAYGAVNSLAQVVLKMVSPGVPDVYQGNEVWRFDLVDPDNRRPVPFEALDDMLGILEQVSNPAVVTAAESFWTTWQDGHIKLWVTRQLLHHRRACAELYANGSYQALTANGAASDHIVAALRQEGQDRVVAIVPRLLYTLSGGAETPPHGGDLWQGTTVAVPPGTYRHLFTGELFESDGELPCDVLFAHFPVAVLTT